MGLGGSAEASWKANSGVQDFKKWKFPGEYLAVSWRLPVEFIVAFAGLGRMLVACFLELSMLGQIPILGTSAQE